MTKTVDSVSWNNRADTDSVSTRWTPKETPAPLHKVRRSPNHYEPPHAEAAPIALNMLIRSQQVLAGCITFSRFIDEMRRFARQVEVDAFVVDLRFNVRGRSSVASAFS